MTISIKELDLTTAPGEEIDDSIRRSVLSDRSIRVRAEAIVSDVRIHGDSSLFDYSERFGGSLADGSSAVDPDLIEKSEYELDSRTADALDEMIANVRTCHEPQRPSSSTANPAEGVTVERVWRPLDRVGVYVPGGRATYPSTLIMGVVPATIAGVPEICVATPAGPEGGIDTIVLAAAAKLGVTEMYAMGGAQAVGALAYGTETIRRVSKIVGPGGPWVTAGKLAVYGECGVDLPAGPSEAAIVADETADPTLIAADVMCQAEHGEESAVVLILTDRALVTAVLDEIERQLPQLDRSDIIMKALESEGRIVLAPDTASALSYANDWAPEHLSIHTADPRSDATAVPNAGSVFIGQWTPEAAGDYATGANHVLPTGGLARSHGPLGVEDFGSWCQIQTLTRQGLQNLSQTIISLAHAEGLTAHANSVSIRLGSS